MCFSEEEKRFFIQMNRIHDCITVLLINNLMCKKNRSKMCVMILMNILSVL